MYDLRLDHQLKDAVGHSGGESCSRSEPIAGQADEKHGKQGDGSSEGKAEQLDIGENRSQSDGDCAEGELLCSQLQRTMAGLFCGKPRSGGQKGHKEGCQQDVAGGGGDIIELLAVLNYIVQHKKILL